MSGENSMDDKLTTLQLLTPKAVLQAMTPESKASVPNGVLERDLVRINQFPFNVGRESRISQVGGKLIRTERVKHSQGDSSNHLYLADAGRPLNISREHFRIDQNGDDYVLIDRCSACGTSVDNQHIGGRDSGGRITLKDGDIIALGVEDTPYVFKFITL